MNSVTRFAVGSALATAAAMPAAAQGGLSNFAVGLSANAPVGAMADMASTGYGLSVRTGIGGDPTSRWSVRGTFNFDYFKGTTQYANIQFLGIGLDLVHKSTDNFYQFAGLQQTSTKYTSKPSASGNQGLRQSNDFGLSGGVGVNATVGTAKVFLEFAATTLFTGAENSNWFPIRFGMRF